MIKTNGIIIAFFFGSLIVPLNFNSAISQVTDQDKIEYKTVIIGSQEWMSENLNVENYRNGDPIPQVQDDEQWKNLTTGAWCYYENNPENGKTCCKLYNWYAVNDSRGLAPNGWHIPSDAEFTKLTDYLGGEDVAGGKLKAPTVWKDPNSGASNESGFTAFPGGYRNFNSLFGGLNEEGIFWSSKQYSQGNLAFVCYLEYSSSQVNNFVYGLDKKSGLSVRCLKNSQ